MTDHWFRFDDQRYANAPDEHGESYGAHTVVTLERFKMLKRTPKGVWLDIGFGSRRFVLDTATRRFACATVEEALTSFKARKKKQASIYMNRAKLAEEAISMAEMGRYLSPPVWA